MTWGTIFIILILLTFTLILSGSWVASALGVAGVLGLLIGGKGNLIHVLGNIAWNLGNDFTMTALPLFLLMGEIILLSGLSRNFYRGVVKFSRFIPGGLLHSNIIACGIFSAISGSSPATAAGIGSVAIPELKRLKYKMPAVYGSIAAGGTLGILIPPSIALIIYGSLTNTSVVKLFTAAMVPGIILASLYVLLILLSSIFLKLRGHSIQNSSEKMESIGFGEACKGFFPMVILIGVVLGGIYTGYATPTEAASFGVVASIIIGKVFGNFTLKKMKPALLRAIKSTSMILFIMLGAQVFSYVLSSTGASRQLVTWLTDLHMSYLLLLIMVYILYIILGCFIDGNSMQFMTIPVLFPVLLEYGVDPIWFGIVLVILIEMGFITPPMGMNLFVVKTIDPSSSLKDICIGAFPYLIVMFLMIAILTVFPGIATFAVAG
jgi:tripartite ATP-independent transporter DctM subunit